MNTLDHWTDAALSATEEFSRTMLGLEGCAVLDRSEVLPNSLRGAYLPIMAGQWSLYVGILSTKEGGAALARTLLGMQESEHIDEADVVDALGEIANVIGGSVKSRMAATGGNIRLSLPIFVDGQVVVSQKTVSRCIRIRLGSIDAVLAVTCTPTEK